MEERRKQNRRKLVILFCKVLGGVLVVGSLLLLVLHFVLPEEELQVYEFFHLPTTPLVEMFAGDVQKG